MGSFNDNKDTLNTNEMKFEKIKKQAEAEVEVGVQAEVGVEVEVGRCSLDRSM